jgi:hypothetical protein
MRPRACHPARSCARVTTDGWHDGCARPRELTSCQIDRRPAHVPVAKADPCRPAALSRPATPSHGRAGPRCHGGASSLLRMGSGRPAAADPAQSACRRRAPDATLVLSRVPAPADPLRPRRAGPLATFSDDSSRGSGQPGFRQARGSAETRGNRSACVRGHTTARPAAARATPTTSETSMRSRVRIVALGLALAATCGLARAQSGPWPNKPVRIVVPFAPGGHDRHPGAGTRARVEQGVRADLHHRQQGRGGRQPRRRSRRQVGARRLHAADGNRRHAVDQPGPLPEDARTTRSRTFDRSRCGRAFRTSS